MQDYINFTDEGPDVLSSIVPSRSQVRVGDKVIIGWIVGSQPIKINIAEAIIKNKLFLFISSLQYKFHKYYNDKYEFLHPLGYELFLYHNVHTL